MLISTQNLSLVDISESKIFHHSLFVKANRSSLPIRGMSKIQEIEKTFKEVSRGNFQNIFFLVFMRIKFREETYFKYFATI